MFHDEIETSKHVADSEYSPVCTEFSIADLKYFSTNIAAEPNYESDKKKCNNRILQSFPLPSDRSKT